MTWKRHPRRSGKLNQKYRHVSGPTMNTVCLTPGQEVSMWYSIAQSGFASVGIDFTDGLSLLVGGLVSLVWLSAGVVTGLAGQYLLAPPHRTEPRGAAVTTAVLWNRRGVAVSF